eukprot:NODE_10467_length_1350_cov_1.790679.p2 GENE.NODE_10467_length_1350_cov_1.790679~~NODE_10467_length_1350_cov_1.790679.p2  ORF type:complete len:224 (-),score=81.60 NODE_10467_length_1350_cov_1.790679:310-981(-)
MAAPECLWNLVFCLLCRHDALCGPAPKEGGALHASVPPEVFDALEGGGGGGVEGFASPLACRGGAWRHCSLFADVDIFFGSLGSFFSPAVTPETIGGFFEVNPPFSRSIVAPMMTKVIDALHHAELDGMQLSFAVFLPGIACEKLLDSSFVRATSGAGHKRYVFGHAHRTDKAWPPMYVQSRCVLLGTSVAASTIDYRATLAAVCRAWRSRAEGSDTESSDDA